MARRAIAQMLQTVESEQRVDKFDHQHRPNSPQLKLAELKHVAGTSTMKKRPWSGRFSLPEFVGGKIAETQI